MKISREWLSDYIDLGNSTDAELAERFTAIGHAVESIEKHGDDTVFEIEFTTNRIDAMSHYGFARDLAAALGVDVEQQPSHAGEVTASGPVPIIIEAADLCSRFSSVLIRGVQVKPSSPEIARRLETVGLRPINNVVDATNYVMLALGHPLHAYDLSRLEGPEIRVRAGRAGEKLRSLDGIERSVDPETVMIADAKKAIGLGGIIGGENSEIETSTTDVLLECAHFNASAVRRTARRLGIRTDASYRFERGVDPNDGLTAITMCADLIVAEAGGTRGELVDIVAKRTEEKKLLLREAKLAEASAGLISLGYALELFTRLGMAPRQVAEGLEVTVPSYRVDMHEEADLVEELLRFFGFNNMPPALPRVTSGDVIHTPVADAEETVRDLLVSFGLTEVVTYSFIDPAKNALFTEEKALGLTNALAEYLSSMRLSLLPGLLETIAHNRAYGNRDGALFEVGRTYHSTAAGIREHRRAAFVLFGNRPSSWGEAKHGYDFYDAKGVFESLGERLRVPIEGRASEEVAFRKGQTAEIFSGQRLVGRVGTVAAPIVQTFDIRGDVVAGEIDIEALVASAGAWKMTPASKFPGVPMVLGMWHGRDLTYQKIVDAIRGFNVPHLQEVGLWDRFVPEKGESGAEVKTALGLWYQSNERSLTQDEVSAAHNLLVQRVADLLPVRVITS